MSTMCLHCQEEKDISIVWLKKKNTRGREYFRRDAMCQECREEIRRDGGDVR
jgi:hypothetical protein